MICSLSSEPLRTPIVADDLGRVMNRTSVVEFLLGAGQFAETKEVLAKSEFANLKSLKDVFELNLTPNPTYVPDDDPSTIIDSSQTTATNFPGFFICPVTQLETNGHHSFKVLRPCGHVFAEKAFTDMKQGTSPICFLCNKPYTKDDIIPLNPTEESVIDELRQRSRDRKSKQNNGKKEKKEKKSKKEKKEKKRKQTDDNANDDKKLKLEHTPTSQTTTSSTTTTSTTSETTSETTTTPTPEATTPTTTPTTT